MPCGSAGHGLSVRTPQGGCGEFSCFISWEFSQNSPVPFPPQQHSLCLRGVSAPKMFSEKGRADKRGDVLSLLTPSSPGCPCLELAEHPWELQLGLQRFWSLSSPSLPGASSQLCLLVWKPQQGLSGAVLPSPRSCSKAGAGALGSDFLHPDPGKIPTSACGWAPPH